MFVTFFTAPWCMFTYDLVFITIAYTMSQDVIIMDVQERNVQFNLPMGEKGWNIIET